MKKAVFIRLDKIGDLVCTLPVDQVQFLKDWDITWVIAKGLSFVPLNTDPRRKFIELDKNDVASSKLQLQKFLEDHRPDVAVSFQAPWWVHFQIWKSKVPLRIGVLSKWHSWLFLNSGVRQKRSLSVKHEADYNLDLVRQINPQQITEASAPVLKMLPPQNKDALTKHSLTPHSYVVVHPGMAGSALNWPVENYIELIQRLL
ncbi:MAG: lipopolysaccharide heptosyltransferase family protein, partial [Proteobacteria bacterium]